MNENKFDKMMKSYCDRETVAFCFKDNKNTVRFTSVIAAILVLAVITAIMIIPNNTQNSFSLTVAAAESEYVGVTHHVVVKDDMYYVSASESESDDISNDIVGENSEVEYLYTRSFLKVIGENIEKVRAYSEKGNLAIAYFAKYYNVTDKYHYENFPPADDVPDSLLVIPYVKNVKGKFVEASIETWEERCELGYSCVDIVDINRNSDEKFISISCYPIDENGKAIMPEYFSSDCNDKVTVEVTYLNGEVQKKYANITFEENNMIVDIIS